MEPKLRRANRGARPHYPLNELPDKALHVIARGLISAKFARYLNDLDGEEWERLFAKAVGAEWTPSNVGLHDIQSGATCWSAKTVKATNPRTQARVRLISGRNSLTYSFGTDDLTKVAPDQLGHQVLDIWNTRVADVRSRFAHSRTVVLLKGKDLLSASLFEFETLRYDPELFKWIWNARGNLEGHNAAGEHCFTWQPHGAQFTIVETVPAKRFNITIKPPANVRVLTEDDLLAALGVDESWIVID